MHGCLLDIFNFCICIFAEIAKSAVGNISVLHGELSRSLQQAQACTYGRSDRMMLFVNAHVYLHQLSCLEDVFLAA